MPKDGGIIGISDHGGWAVLVTVAREGTLSTAAASSSWTTACPRFRITTRGRGYR